MPPGTENLFHKEHPRNLIPELSLQFYNQGWFNSTGGGISIKQGNNIYMAPAGVQMERLEPNDLFTLKTDGTVGQSPPPEKKLVLCDIAPLFMHAYKERNAGAVLHSRDKSVVLASMIYEGSEFRIRNQDMIKGVYNPVEQRDMRADEELVVPIIENSDLNDTMLQSIKAQPLTNAVIVRNNGIYVWGDSWQQCKAMAEAYHYLCELSVEMEKLGINEYTHMAQAPASTSSATKVPTPNKAVEVNGVKETPESTQDADKSKPTTKVPTKTSTKTPVKATSTTPRKTPTQQKKTPNNSRREGLKGVRGGGRVLKRGGANSQQNRRRSEGKGGIQAPWSQPGPQQWNGPPMGGPPMMMMGPPHMGPPMMGPMGAGHMNGAPMGGPPMMGRNGTRRGRGGARSGARGGARGGAKNGVKRNNSTNKRQQQNAESKKKAKEDGEMANILMNY